MEGLENPSGLITGPIYPSVDLCVIFRMPRRKEITKSETADRIDVIVSMSRIHKKEEIH